MDRKKCEFCGEEFKERTEYVRGTTAIVHQYWKCGTWRCSDGMQRQSGDCMTRQRDREIAKLRNALRDVLATRCADWRGEGFDEAVAVAAELLGEPDLA